MVKKVTTTRSRKIDASVDQTYSDFRSSFALVTKARANIWITTAVVLFVLGSVIGLIYVSDPNALIKGSLNSYESDAAFARTTYTPTQGGTINTPTTITPGGVVTPTTGTGGSANDNGQCIRRQPSIVYSGPGSSPNPTPTSTAPINTTNGSTVNYLIKVKNNDSISCGSTEFSVGHAPHAGVSALFAFSANTPKTVRLNPGATSGNITIPARPMAVNPTQKLACYNPDATPQGKLCDTGGLVAYYISARHSIGTTSNPVVCPSGGSTFEAGRRDVFLKVTGGEYQEIRTVNQDDPATEEPWTNPNSYPTEAWATCVGGPGSTSNQNSGSVELPTNQAPTSIWQRVFPFLRRR